MSNTVKVYRSYWEDHEGNYTFFYTGKNSVLGRSHPEYVYKNDDKYKFARVAFYDLEDTGDDTTFTYINETLSVIMMAGIESDLHADKMASVQIHVESKAIGGRIIPDTTTCTVTNYNIKLNDASIIITEDSYLVDSETRYGLGVWIGCSDMLYVLTTSTMSLASNSIPLDCDFYPATYRAIYLTNDTKENDINVTNIEEFLLNRSVVDPFNTKYFIEDRVAALEEKVKNEPHQYIQNTVQYNPNYVPTKERIEEAIQGATVRGPVLDRIIALDPVDKSFHVLKDGIYALQLKNGLYLVQGESRVDLTVYKNDNAIKEMNMSSYIKSNPPGMDDNGKVLKNTYSSQVYITPLKTTDKIKLTATWMDITDIQLENECMMSVTALQYNLATV